VLSVDRVPFACFMTPRANEQVFNTATEGMRVFNTATEGMRAMVVCTGPVLLSQAMAAAARLGGVGVVSLPWLRDVDGGRLAGVAGEAPIVVLDNHWHVGGRGDAVRAALDGRRVAVWGIDRVPAWRSNEEVLREHRLDAASLAERLHAL
jgi:transketolase C-terminal domain/subunit